MRSLNPKPTQTERMIGPGRGTPAHVQDAGKVNFILSTPPFKCQVLAVVDLRHRNMILQGVVADGGETWARRFHSGVLVEEGIGYLLSGGVCSQRLCPPPDLLSPALYACSSKATDAAFQTHFQVHLESFATMMSQPASLPGPSGALLANCKKPGLPGCQN
jgi:hypothetical protein